MATKSDFKTGKSRIRRDSICGLLGLKDLDAITKHINCLIEKGLVKKSYLDTSHLKVMYEIVTLTKNFVLVSRDIINADLTDKQLGLYASLISVSAGRKTIELPFLYKECGVAKRTYYKYLNELVEMELVENEDGIVSLFEFLPNIKALNKTASKVWDDFKEMNEELTSDEQSPKYKEIKKKEATGWDGINSPSNYVLKMLVGVTMRPIRKTNKISYNLCQSI